jgi:hypothetical protein
MTSSLAAGGPLAWLLVVVTAVRLLTGLRLRRRVTRPPIACSARPR